MKDILSDIGTKSESTIYLAEKALIHSKTDSNRMKSIRVTQQNNTFVNIAVPEISSYPITRKLLYAST